MLFTPAGTQHSELRHQLKCEAVRRQRRPIKQVSWLCKLLWCVSGCRHDAAASAVQACMPVTAANVLASLLALA